MPPVGTGAFFVAAAGLPPNTLHYYRCWASNAAGVAWAPASTNFLTPALTLTDGLVAWYPFNGNANDATTNGNNASVNPAIPAPDRFGTAASAYAFGSDSQRITVPNSASLNINGHVSLSVAAWVCVTDATRPQQGIVWKWGPGLTGDDQYVLCLYSDRVAFHLSDVPTRVESPGLIVTGRWYHVAGVYDAASDRLAVYVNGALGTQTKRASINNVVIWWVSRWGGSCSSIRRGNRRG
jgi:hypothetical protein